MKFTEKINRDLMDVNLPGIFVTNNMSSLDETSLKLYIYIKFLAKNNMDFSESDIAKKIGIKAFELDKAFSVLESEELIIKSIDGYELIDVKEQEINKTHIPKLKPKQSEAKTIIEKKRIAAATAINESFFQGIMALSWYVDISTLFEKYCFDEDVMIALFHECSERKALNKKYVFKVAETWYKGGVKTFEQLEEYQSKQDVLTKLKGKIKSKLRLNRSFTEYEEAYIEEWTSKYGYGIDEIDYAIKKTLAKGNPSIGYINGILKNWNEKKFKNLAAVLESESTVTKQKISVNKDKAGSSVNKNLKHKNYEQRKDINWNEYYDNV